MLDRKSLHCFEEIPGRNMDVKGALGEVSDGVRRVLLETGGKGDPC